MTAHSRPGEPPRQPSPEACPIDAVALPAHLRGKTKLLVKEAAEYLEAAHGIKAAPSTLNKRRCTGGGPKFFKLPNRAVLYARVDLDAWAAEQLGQPVGSTSEADNRKGAE